MKSSHSLLACALALLLLLFCALAIIPEIRALRERDFTSLDEQIRALAWSVDNTVASYIDMQTQTLQYVVERGGFISAQQTYLTTGDAEELLGHMRENLLMQDDMFVCMTAETTDGVLFSTDGCLTYAVETSAALYRKNNVDILLCRREDTLYLMLRTQTDSGLLYGAIVDLQRFYRRVATDGTIFSMDNHIVLVDASQTFCLHPHEEEITVCLTSDNASICAGLPFMTAAQQAGDALLVSYAIPAGTQAGDTAHMAIVPAQQSKNGLFTIGVSINFDESTRPLYQAVLRMACMGGIAMASMLFLLYHLVGSFRREEKSRREIRQLTEKNLAIEAVNRSQQTLLHHQRLQTIGELTSGVAHEFGNLLTPIMGYSLMALERLDENSALYDDLLHIYEASVAAQTMTRRLLTLSRADVSGVHTPQEPHALLSQAAQMIAPCCGDRIRLVTSLNAPDVTFSGDATQLMQMLLNLCINALHAMEERGGTLTLEATCDAQHVMLSVSDTGCGMSEQTLAKMYEPFFTTRESSKGTGLGLFTVRQIADVHEASIRVHSALNEGTRFDVCFPRL